MSSGLERSSIAGHWWSQSRRSHNLFDRRLHNGKPVAKIGSRYASLNAIPSEHACVEVIAFTDVSVARRKLVRLADLLRIATVSPEQNGHE